MRGIDCATPVSAQAAAILKAEGFEFVCRYLVPESYTKALTKMEAERLSAAGLHILCVWETSASRMKQGAAAGREDGARAYQRARELDIPWSAILYFAADFDALSEDMDAIRAYLAAARTQIGVYQIGVYGSWRTIEAMQGYVSGFWQCVAWSGGRVSEHLTVYQAQWQGTAECQALAAKVGFAVDIDECPDMDRAGMWSYLQEPEEPKKDYEGHWAENSIRWGIDNRLLTGYEDGTFRPDKPMTRAEVITLLRRYHDMGDDGE